MKIFLQKDNYTQEKGYYSLPDTALNRVGMPLFLPDYAHKNAMRPQLAVRISRLGKTISKRFAHRYYKEATVAICCEATQSAEDLRTAHIPILPAIGFDGAVNIGKWVPFHAGDDAVITCYCNDNAIITYDANKMLQHIDDFIAHLSSYHMLCQGDILLCGAPFQAEAKLNDVFTASLNGQSLLHFRIK